MKTLVIAMLSIVLSVAAQFSLRAGMSSEAVASVLAQPLSLRSALAVLTNWHVLAGFMLYGLGALVWLAVLSKWDVSKAYPLVGLGFVFTVAIGYLAGERVTVERVLGVALICAGVIVVSRT
jgi:drug/metabolite transporter (DMT)-like permease